MSKTVCIIQARMGSTRLPGKVLYDLAGCSMLERVVYRAYGASDYFDDLVVATGNNVENDVIEEICEYNHWKCIRGSEQDVLSRYKHAASTMEADTIVRVCADDPFIDPRVIAETILAYYTNDIEYAATETLKQTFPIGMAVEVMSNTALTRAFLYSEIKDREHVTPFIWKNQDRFKCHAVVHDKNLSHIRLTVDTLDDYRRARKLYNKFGNSNFHWEDVVWEIERRPQDYDYNT